jgi:polysaccharide biosynthesis/export protein
MISIRRCVACLFLVCFFLTGSSFAAQAGQAEQPSRQCGTATTAPCPNPEPPSSPHNVAPKPIVQQPTRNGSNQQQEQQRNQEQEQQRNQLEDQQRNQHQGQNETNERKLEQPTQFQTFVSTAIGHFLPLFGYDLFQGTPSSFTPNGNVAATTDYVLGPGDEIRVTTWGQLDSDVTTTVSPAGSIFIPRIGNIQVAGVRYSDLDQLIRTNISHYYHNFQLQVQLGQLRSIQVIVVGHAERPGTFTISGLSTLVTGLFATGGPSNSGSMRHILLKRQGKVIADLDLYDLLVHGNSSADVRLLAGDIIYIPPSGPMVALSGATKTAAIFELKGTTTLDGLLELAGGTTTTALPDRVKMQRFNAKKVRTVQDVELTSGGRNLSLQDGDIVDIPTVSERIDNAVTLRGHVAKPGLYPYQPNMTLRDLIPNEAALITPQYWQEQNARGVRATNNSRSEISAATARSQIVTVPDVNWDYAIIERMNPQTLIVELQAFDLGKLVLQHDESANVALLPGDTVTIFSDTDVAVPLEKRNKLVTIGGEVARPGIYRVGSGETLRDIVARAGGTTPRAYVFAAEVIRQSVRLTEQEKLQGVIRRLEQEILSEAPASSENNASSNDSEGAAIRRRQQQALLGDLRMVEATGRLVLNLKPDSQTEDLPTLPLDDGDSVIIPARQDTVAVIGAVNQPAVFLMDSNGSSAARYLKRAGGKTKMGDKGEAFVVRANGSVVHPGSGGLGSLRAYPGDTVVVPGKIGRMFIDQLKDIAQIAGQFGLAAAAIHVLSQ